MIRIRYRMEDMSIEVKGHAGTAPPGMDLVCCAVSTLVGCMINAFTARQEKGEIKDIDGDFTEGDAHFRIIPEEWARVSCLVLMRTYIEALHFTADSYPEAITMEER